tara:strand:- start:84 stop:644 length:561 start_codon:yes stop_codon:yes gene_type:complete
MIRNLTILMAVVLFTGCSSKLKIYNLYGLMEDTKIKKDNYYLKDVHNYYKRLKGTWVWANKSDTLLFEINPVYKKRIPKMYPFDNRNTYYDINEISFKFISDNGLILNEYNSTNNNCLIASPMGIYTNKFYLYNSCYNQSGSPILMYVGNDLVLIHDWNEEEGVFLEKEGEYKIIIPRIIILKRME